MKRNILAILLAAASLNVLAEGKPIVKRARIVATCTGASPCKACKNCKYCKKCAKDGGSCGVCKK